VQGRQAGRQEQPPVQRSSQQLGSNTTMLAVIEQPVTLVCCLNTVLLDRGLSWGLIWLAEPTGV